jgi:high-affinity Fe2+/Pb2+ permease
MAQQLREATPWGKGHLSATILGWVLFSSCMKLSLRGFFGATKILLIVFAADLVGLGIHEFNESDIIPSVIGHVWDVNGLLSDKSEVGLLLKALVGYNGNPSLCECNHTAFSLQLLSSWACQPLAMPESLYNRQADITS